VWQLFRAGKDVRSGAETENKRNSLKDWLMTRDQGSAGKG
jgi:hypothetical protein